MWLNDIDKLSTLFSNSFWSFLFCLFYVGFRNGNAISPYIVNIGYHLIGGGVNVSLTKKKNNSIRCVCALMTLHILDTIWMNAVAKPCFWLFSAMLGFAKRHFITKESPSKTETSHRRSIYFYLGACVYVCGCRCVHMKKIFSECYIFGCAFKSKLPFRGFVMSFTRNVICKLHDDHVVVVVFPKKVFSLLFTATNFTWKMKTQTHLPKL